MDGDVIDLDTPLDVLWASLVSCPAALAVVDPAGRVVRTNAAFTALLGRRDGDLAGAVHPDDLAAASAPHGRPLPAGRCRARWLTADGSPIWCLTTVWAVADHRYWIHQLEDISEPVELSAALADSEERLRLFIDTVTEYAIFRLDPQGRICRWNSGAERINGYTADEVMGRHYRLLFTEEEILAGVPDANLHRAVTEGAAAGEGWRRRKDGSHFWASWSLTSIVRDGEHVGFAKITRDLTTQREAAAQLTAYAQRLEESARVRDELLSIANHELRTPLAAILGFSETLARGWDRMSPGERRTALDAITAASHRLGALVDNLVALSALQSGNRPLVRRDVRLGRAVREAAVMRDVDLAHASIDVPDRLVVSADPGAVRQIIANLLTNASTHGGGVTEVTARQRASTIALDVADQGPGVPDDFVPHLFDRWSQASRGLTRTAQGAGLGLAGVRELSRALGGDAFYAPNTPRGARFTVELPAG